MSLLATSGPLWEHTANPGSSGWIVEGQGRGKGVEARDEKGMRRGDAPCLLAFIPKYEMLDRKPACGDGYRKDWAACSVDNVHHEISDTESRR